MVLLLGCILAEQLGIELRRVGSGKRMTFSEGEQPWTEAHFAPRTLELADNAHGFSHFRAKNARQMTQAGLCGSDRLRIASNPLTCWQ
jgi:hypothetical protein